MSRDWVGNSKSTFTTLGASNHAVHDRDEHDYYATEPRVIDELLSVEQFDSRVWEPACGEGHLSKRLKELGVATYSTDLIDRGYGDDFVDFLSCTANCPDTHIVTNPPYRYARQFVEKSLELVEPRYKVAMFLKVTFLEGQERYKLFEKHPPRAVYIYSSRRKCAINGDFASVGSSASAYAWFVWEKGYHGEPVIRWLK